MLAYWQGNYQQACADLEKCILLGEKFNYQLQILWARINLAYVVLRQGDIQRAREMFGTSIEKTYKANLTIALVYAIEGIASLCVNQDQPERAVHLFAWADAMREKIGDHRPPVEQASVERDLAVIRSKLDDISFEKAYNIGRVLTLEKAIALAVDE